MRAELVDRGSELAAFQARLTAEVAGPGALVVSGAPGIGKTRLLAEFARRATGCGVRVIGGQASARERDVPFAAVAEVITGLLRPVPGRPALPAAIGGGLAELLAPALRSGACERYGVLRTALDLTAGRQGLVVLLDDLHWADQGTVELLGYLLRHPCSTRVVLVMAYRPRQVPGRLAAAVAAAADAGGARRVEVGPLSVQGVRKVAGPAASARLVRQVHAESGGNPLYAMTLLAEASTAGAEQFPMDVDAVLRADLEALSPAATTVARSAAVLGAVFDIDAVAEVAELPTGTVSTALDELSRADLVRPDPVPSRLRFRHPLLRRMAYRQASVAWRRSAHARAAALYAGQGAPIEDWAHHVEQSATVGDGDAVALLVRAADAIRFRAPHIAAQWFAAAARLLPDLSSPTPRLAALLLAKAETLTMAGELRQSRLVVGEVLTALTPGSDDYVRAVLHAALVEHLLGQPREAAALLRRGLRAVCPTGPQAALLWLELARIELAGGEPSVAQDALRRGLAAADDHADLAQTALAGGVRAVAAYASGDIDLAIAVAGQVGALVDGMPDPELARHLRAVAWLGWIDLLLGHYREVSRRQGRAVELARGSGQLHMLPLLLVSHGFALRWLGRLDEACRCFTEAAEIARSTGATPHLTLALTGSRHIASLTGDDTGAAALTEELRASAADTDGWFATRAAVSAWASRAVVAAAAEAVPVAAGFAALAQSHARTAAGDVTGTARYARAAVAAFERAGTPIEVARAALLAGRALAAAGRRDEALAYLDRGREHSATTGARSLHNEITRELRRLGLRPPPSPARRTAVGPTLEILSPREREVAVLVAQGCTNRTIAGTLFLSEKTVERHLGRTFIKLDISSRAALAALIATHAATTAA